MKLRPYQSDLIQEVRSKFSKGNKRVILCAPTGAGKTVIFTKIVVDTIEKDMFARVLIITDRIELFKQTFSSLSKAGADPEFYGAKTDWKKPITSRCVVAMVETIKRRNKTGKLNIGDFKLIIIDEAHKGNFLPIFDIWPNAFVIGATATPIATDKKKPLKNFYHDIAFKVDIPDLIPEGYLSQVQNFKMVPFDTSKLSFDSRKGDFSDKSLSAAFSTPQVYDGVHEMYERHGKGKKTIIFCVNIAESEKVAELLGAFIVTSKSSKEEREWNLTQFHNSKDGVMVNCGILTTGYDHPPIECVIMLRATVSLPLWLQCCGRASRISPNKERFIIIDMGDNIDRLGRWEDERDWVTWFKNPPKPGQVRPAPSKECPKCKSIIHARVMQCEFCGHIFEAKEKEFAEGDIIEVNPTPTHLKNRYISDLSPKELLELVQAKKYKFGFAVRVCRSKGEEFMRMYGHLAGYKHGWHTHHVNGDSNFKNFKIQ